MISKNGIKANPNKTWAIQDTNLRGYWGMYEGWRDVYPISTDFFSCTAQLELLFFKILKKANAL